MAKRHLSWSCSNLSSSAHCWPLCSAWTPHFSWLPWHCLLIIIISFNLHSNISVTHMLKLAGLHAFLSYPPITCVRTKAYLVQQGQSNVQVPGEEGPEDSDRSIVRLIFQLLLLLLLPLSIIVENLWYVEPWTTTTKMLNKLKKWIHLERKEVGNLNDQLKKNLT